MFQSQRAVAVPFYFVIHSSPFGNSVTAVAFIGLTKRGAGGELRLARFVSERRLSLGRGRLETRRSSVSAICSIVRPLNAETPWRFAEVVCAFLLVLRKIHSCFALIAGCSLERPFAFQFLAAQKPREPSFPVVALDQFIRA